MVVTLLTQENCAFCEQARELLAKLAGEFSLSISVVALDTPAGQELAERGGILFPPGIFVDGVAVSYGRPSLRRLRRELGLRDGGRSREGS